jgi:hypothetical protein
MTAMTRFCFSLRCALSMALLALPAAPAAAEEIEVKVLAILVSEQHKDVHPKLKEFAREVQKKDSNLTGFKLARTTVESLDLGETKKFTLVNGQVVEVTVNKERNEKGRITLTIKPPKLDQITYECACDKFFSMATQHYVGKGKDKEQLFIAVMAKPCVPAKKQK